MDELVVLAHINLNVIFSGDVPQRIGHVSERVKFSPLAQLEHFLEIVLQNQLGIQIGKIDIGIVVHLAVAVQGNR